MEEDIEYLVHEPHAQSKITELITERLKAAADTAEEHQKFDAAHDASVQLSLDTVRRFLIKRQRVCYGGTAMNAILPISKRFYNPELDLPDYDFFTPTIDEDVAELVQDMKDAGFKEIYYRMGMHEGTIKLMVNFIPVADITAMDPVVYSVVHTRALIKEGVHYTDPNILRMMMYLELSRPKGEVTRWEKVFERLTLINNEFPIERTTKFCKQKSLVTVPADSRRVIYDLIFDRQRILCSGPLELIYAQGIRSKNATLNTKTIGGPILFVSPTPREDAAEIKGHLEGCQIFLYKAKGGIVPERIEVRQEGEPIALIITDTACHSYNQVPTSDGKIALIGSLEFLISLYLSLDIFTKPGPFFLKPVMCIVKELVALCHKNYVANSSQFPPFAISCKGYQKGFTSLLREKLHRIRRQRGQTSKSGRPIQRPQRIRTMKKKHML
jgi:hypothetical protein